MYRECIENGIPTIVKLLQVFFAESKKLNLLWNELKPFNRDKNLYINHFIQILLNTSLKTGQQYIVAMRNLYTPTPGLHRVHLFMILQSMSRRE